MVLLSICYCVSRVSRITYRFVSGAYSFPISSALVLSQDINMGAALPKADGKVAPKLGIAADTSEKKSWNPEGCFLHWRDPADPIGLGA